MALCPYQAELQERKPTQSYQNFHQRRAHTCQNQASCCQVKPLQHWSLITATTYMYSYPTTAQKYNWLKSQRCQVEVVLIEDQDPAGEPTLKTQRCQVEVVPVEELAGEPTVVLVEPLAEEAMSFQHLMKLHLVVGQERQAVLVEDVLV